jgi:hypothetical protein
MFNPSDSYLQSLLCFIKFYPAFDLLVVLFIAGYFLLARHWNKKKDRWLSPFFLLYSLLPLAMGLAFTSYNGSYDHLYRVSNLANPYIEFAYTRFILILSAGATLLVLILRLARAKSIWRQEVPNSNLINEPRENKGCRLGLILSVSGVLLAVVLMAGDLLFFNFSNALLPLDSLKSTVKTFEASARMTQAGMHVASIALFVLTLLATVICSMRPSRCRPTPRQEQALLNAMYLLMGALLLFLAYCVSQSWFLGRMIIPF